MVQSIRLSVVSGESVSDLRKRSLRRQIPDGLEAGSIPSVIILVLVLASIALVGTTVRGDWPSDSSNTLPSVPVAPSRESAAKSGEATGSDPLTERGFRPRGGVPSSKATVETQRSDEIAIKPFTLTFATGQPGGFADLPVVAEPAEAPHRGFSVIDTLRMLVLGSLGLLLMRRVQHQWKTPQGRR